MDHQVILSCKYHRVHLHKPGRYNLLHTQPTWCIQPAAPRLQICTACHCTEYSRQLKHRVFVEIHHLCVGWKEHTQASPFPSRPWPLLSARRSQGLLKCQQLHSKPEIKMKNLSFYGSLVSKVCLLSSQLIPPSSHWHQSCRPQNLSLTNMWIFPVCSPPSSSLLVDKCRFTHWPKMTQPLWHRRCWSSKLWFLPKVLGQGATEEASCKNVDFRSSHLKLQQLP